MAVPVAVEAARLAACNAAAVADNAAAARGALAADYRIIAAAPAEPQWDPTAVLERAEVVAKWLRHAEHVPVVVLAADVPVRREARGREVALDQEPEQQVKRGAKVDQAREPVKPLELPAQARVLVPERPAPRVPGPARLSAVRVHDQQPMSINRRLPGRCVPVAP